MTTCSVEELPIEQASHAPQRLLDSFQFLKNVIDFINYQDSTERAARVLPEIIKLLVDTDRTVVGEAASLMHQLAKKEPSKHAIIGTQNAIISLVHVMASTNDPDIQRNISGALYHLSKTRPGLMQIYNSGGIHHLVKLLTSPVDAVLFFVISTLHNLLEHYVPSKMAICFAGGIQKMITLLSKDNVKFLTITIDCLYMLAYRHQDRKLIIFSRGGPAYLVRIMRSYSFEKLLIACTKLLKVLSVCARNKPAIVQAGGVQVLAMFLNHDNDSLVQNVLWILRNLSDVANKQDNLDSLLFMLIKLLYSTNENVVLCAAGILSNLTCNNVKVKVIVTQMHGTKALVHVLINAGDQEDIIYPAVCALRHLTSRHPQAEKARDVIRTHNGITTLATLLKSPAVQKSLVKAASGLITNLSLSAENQKVLEKHGLLSYILKKKAIR